MTDFLTRLLARTQGTIPVEQLAQPLLKSTFAPISMSVEQPVESYEERDASSELSHVAEKTAQKSSQVIPQAAQHPTIQRMPTIAASIQNQTDESFEASNTPQLTSNVIPDLVQSPSMQQQIGRDETSTVRHEPIHELLEEGVGQQENQYISYSHNALSIRPVQPVLSALSAPPTLQHSQFDIMQVAKQQPQSLPPSLQSSTFFHEQDNLTNIEDDANASNEDVFENQELLVDSQQPTLSELQPHGVSSSLSAGLQENSEEVEQIVAQMSSVESTESVKAGNGPGLSGEYREYRWTLDDGQGANELLLSRQIVSRNVARGLERKEDGRDSKGTIEQEPVEYREANHSLRENVEQEQMQREETGRVQRERVRDTQERVIEAVRHEQSRRDDVPLLRRIIPTQVHTVKQEQGSPLSTNKPMQPEVTPQMPPTIQVSIGRIEVRAVTAPTPTPRAKPVRPSPSLSLEEYLKQQGGGR